MINFKEIDISNIETLQKNIFKEKSVLELKQVISIWNNKVYNGKYFEMLGVFNNDILVGIISLKEQSKSSVSFGLEIFEKYRKLGYGYESLMFGFEKAKQKGYKITINQVRIDNSASITLCKKCNLESDFYEYINKKGNQVYIFYKQI